MSSFFCTGFVTLALAYFGVDDLPKRYNKVEIEYFEEALDLVAERDDVDGDRIGIFGISKGKAARRLSQPLRSWWRKE